MIDFLAQIMECRRRDVAVAMARTPLEELRAEAGRRRPERRSLFSALQKAGTTGIIAEIKRASPSKGDLAPHLNPAAVARSYEKGGAAALSVLTEPRFFKGSNEDLQAARNAVSLPVLRKDFLFCDYQVYESAAIGADAILLIARILPPGELERLHALAQDLGLEALVEAASEDEVERACRLGASLIGINTRDLQTFSMDLERAVRLAPPAAEGRIVISLSGVSSRDDIARQRAACITRFLVGEALVRASDPVEALRRLRGAEKDS